MNNTFTEKMAALYQNVPSALLVSIRVAQAVIESGYGQSELARLANNFAGIKASREWQGSVHVKYSDEHKNGQTVSERSAFRKYATIDEFIKDHSNFITSSEWRKGHYAKVINAKTYQEQARALTGTYATDPAYADKLIKIIEQHQLYRYDTVANSKDTVERENNNMAKHLVICGHGMKPNGEYDPGATGRNGTEAEWVRKLASAMKNYSGADIEYVTETNVYEFRYDNRYNINRYSGYESITELHLNAFDKQAKGCEVLIWHEFNADDLDNKLLAILAKYFVNRGIKKRNDLYNMRVSAQLGYNYRLVECCFVDNNNDMQIFSANLDSIARGFVEAILGKVTQQAPTQPQQTPSKPAEQPTERQGNRTPDEYPSAFKELSEGQVVEVRQQATHYRDGQPINPRVNGQKYTITGKQVFEKSYSKRAYRLAHNGVAIGWVLEQDIIEAWQAVEQAKPTEDNQFTINGKRYKVVEE